MCVCVCVCVLYFREMCSTLYRRVRKKEHGEMKNYVQVVKIIMLFKLLPAAYVFQLENSRLVVMIIIVKGITALQKPSARQGEISNMSQA